MNDKIYPKSKESQSKSRYTVRYHEAIDRVAIIEKDTGNVVESFSDDIPEGLLVQRMSEIREQELFREKIFSGTGFESSPGIILP